MPRPKAFDVDTVLDKAMHAFWENGYEATSMADLMAAMGLQKGSIYQAFGDKYSLYLAVLQRYLDTHYRGFREELESASSASEALRQVFTKRLVTLSESGEPKRGCFATNATVERGSQDGRVNALLIRQRERIEKLFEGTIRQGQKDGEFRTDIPAKEMAAHAFVLMSGMMAESKTLKAPRRTRKVGETFLKSLKR